MALIKSELRDHLYFFGYTNDPDVTVQNETAFFNFDEHREEDKKIFKGYLAHNKKILATLGTQANIGEYVINGPDAKKIAPLESLSDKLHYD